MCCLKGEELALGIAQAFDSHLDGLFIVFQ